jgi:hypothetical protein
MFLWSGHPLMRWKSKLMIDSTCENSLHTSVVCAVLWVLQICAVSNFFPRTVFNFFAFDFRFEKFHEKIFKISVNFWQGGKSEIGKKNWKRVLKSPKLRLEFCCNCLIWLMFWMKLEWILIPQTRGYLMPIRVKCAVAYDQRRLRSIWRQSDRPSLQRRVSFLKCVRYSHIMPKNDASVNIWRES